MENKKDGPLPCAFLHDWVYTDNETIRHCMRCGQHDILMAKSFKEIWKTEGYFEYIPTNENLVKTRDRKP